MWRFWYDVSWNTSENYDWQYNWKKFNPKKCSFLVKAPRNAQSAAGNSLREVQQNIETLGTEVKFTRIRKEATFIHEVAVGRFSAASDEDDGFGDRTPVCREYTSPTAESDARNFAAIKQRTIIGTVLQIHAKKCLDIYGIEMQIPSTISPKKNSWVVICRGQNRHVQELRHLEPGPNPISKELLRVLLQRKRVSCCRDEPIPRRGNSCAAGTCSCESRMLCERDYSYGTKEVDWHSCKLMAPGRCSCNRNLKIGHENGTSLWSRWKRSRRRCSLGFDGTKIAKCVPEAWKFRILGYGLGWYISWGSHKIRFQLCMISKDDNSLLYIRAFQGNTGRKLIARELLGHVAILYNWKEFIMEVLSIVLQFSSQDLLLREKRSTMDDKQFSSHLSIRYLSRNHEKYAQATISRNQEKNTIEASGDLLGDAVHWVNLARAQDEGLQFRQTRSNATVLYSSVPPECIYKVTSRSGRETPRPPPKVVLKSSWQT